MSESASHDNVTNLPATREIREVRVASPGTDLITIARQTQQIRELGQTLIASGLLPDSIKKPETAVAIMIKGQELDIGPMYALSHISIIKGKPALSAELMGALVHRAGHTLRVIEMSNKGCVVEGIRRDDPAHKTRVRFDETDARKAGLLGQSNYQKYPQDLYRSRAISRLCRSTFQDAIMGMSYTPEELGAEVDEEGQVLSVEPEPSRASARSETRSEEPEVVEAEIVEESQGEKPAASATPGDILKSQIGRIENLSQWIWNDKRAVEKKVLKGHRIEELNQDRAKSIISGLQKTRERIEAEEDGGTPGEEGEATAGSPASAEPRMIREDQHDRLVELLDELYSEEDDEGVSGHRRYEKEILAKPLPALTEAQANEVLGRVEERLAEARGEASGDDRKAKGELPATKKQRNYLEALIVDVVEDGVGRFEEMVGKPIGELTRDEASEWIKRLSGRVS